MCGNRAVHDLVGGRGVAAAQKRGEVCGNGVVHDLVRGGMRQQGRARRGGRCETTGSCTTRRDVDTSTEPRRKRASRGCGNGAYTNKAGEGTWKRGRVK